MLAINYCIACSNPDAILIEELKFLVSFNFNEFACNHLGRAGHRAAHAFAALGYWCIKREELITSSIPDDV